MADTFIAAEILFVFMIVFLAITHAIMFLFFQRVQAEQNSTYILKNPDTHCFIMAINLTHIIKHMKLDRI